MAKSKPKTAPKVAPKIAKDRRQEILTAAAQVITERGLAETRIQDIAEVCGVSAGLILYYFESKDRLLVEALTHANDQFYLRLSRELRKDPSAKAQLDRLIELSVPGLMPDYGFLDEWALWVEIWVLALRDPEMAKEHEVLNRRWRRSITDIVRHGREIGEFPPGRDADELGIQIGALIDGLAIQVLMDHSDVTPEDMFRVGREVSATLIGFALEPAGA